MKLPWIEKHRPAALEGIVGNEPIVQVFRCFAAEGSMPNLIVTGPPGIGKTTAVLCLLRAITLGASPLDKERILEMNASDERGIEVVRTKIKSFLQRKAWGPKFVVLDESDSMTAAAQQTMRRLIEKHADSRFIFICNDLARMVEPVQSRCAILKFGPLTERNVEDLVEKVASEEGIRVTPSAVRMIAEACDGDARQAVNLVQTASNISSGVVDDEVVAKIVNVPPMAKVSKILEEAPLNYESAVGLLDSLFDDGYSYEDVSRIMFKCVRDSGSVRMMEETGKLIMRVSEGCGSRLQFYALIRSSLQ